jgi:hypothetical protein
VFRLNLSVLLIAKKHNVNWFLYEKCRFVSNYLIYNYLDYAKFIRPICSTLKQYIHHIIIIIIITIIIIIIITIIIIIIIIIFYDVGTKLSVNEIWGFRGAKVKIYFVISKVWT